MIRRHCVAEFVVLCHLLVITLDMTLTDLILWFEVNADILCAPKFNSVMSLHYRTLSEEYSLISTVIWPMQYVQHDNQQMTWWCRKWSPFRLDNSELSFLFCFHVVKCVKNHDTKAYEVNKCNFEFKLILPFSQTTFCHALI